MITTKLKGGLGNQMFQYAIGRNLAHINKDKLSLDKSFYNQTRPYPYPCHINAFDITDSKKPNNGYPLREGTLQYNAELFENIKFKKWGNYTLDGYWQDERYFRTIRSLLINDLKLRPEYMSNEYHRYIEILMEFSEPVFVHVRRAERANDTRAKSVHGLVDPYYYRRAMKHVKRKLPDATFIFFSDDFDYCYRKYSDKGVIINTLNDYEHFSLMCQCKHGIIANSSFSWWTAWLLQNEKKIVVAPNRWTTNPNGSNREIVLKEWKKIHPGFI